MEACRTGDSPCPVPVCRNAWKSVPEKLLKPLMAPGRGHAVCAAALLTTIARRRSVSRSAFARSCSTALRDARMKRSWRAWTGSVSKLPNSSMAVEGRLHSVPETKWPTRTRSDFGGQARPSRIARHRPILPAARSGYRRPTCVTTLEHRLAPKDRSGFCRPCSLRFATMKAYWHFTGHSLSRRLPVWRVSMAPSAPLVVLVPALFG